MCAWVHMGVGILLAVKFRHERRTSVKGQRKSLRQKRGTRRQCWGCFLVGRMYAWLALSPCSPPALHKPGWSWCMPVLPALSDKGRRLMASWVFSWDT